MQQSLLIHSTQSRQRICLLPTFVFWKILNLQKFWKNSTMNIFDYPPSSVFTSAKSCHVYYLLLPGFPGGPVGKESACQCRRRGSGRSPGEANGNPLQYSCLGNSTDREAWRATVHGVAKSRTWLSDYTTTTTTISCSRTKTHNQC